MTQYTFCVLRLKVVKIFHQEKTKSLMKHHWLPLRARQIVFNVPNNLDNFNPQYYHHALQIMASGQT
jgi:hypothetical protein